MLFPLLLATATLASPNRGLPRVSNNSEEDYITQLDMLPFLLKLEPTPVKLEGEDRLETMVQIVIDDYIASETSGLDYVLLAGCEIVEWDGDAKPPSTTIKFNQGVASFSGPEKKDYDVNAGAMQATTSYLLDLLQGTTDFGGITSITYISTTEAPTTAPDDNQNKVAAVQRTPNNTNEKETVNTGAIVGSLLGVAFVVFASILRIRKSGQVRAMLDLYAEDKSLQMDDDTATEVDDAELDQNQQEDVANECASQRAHYHDAASTDQGSVTSEWTTTSRDTSTAAGLRKNEMMVHAETFERDRQVTLKKDLLLSPWNGDAASPPRQQQQQQPSMPLTPRARGRQDFASWRTQQGDVNSDSPFRFEQAHEAQEAQGEEVFFVPPSQTRKSRPAKDFVPPSQTRKSREPYGKLRAEV
jgi:hypothetical protein